MTSVLPNKLILISKSSLKANVFTNIETGGEPINLATTDKHMNILKMFHGPDYYKYLVQCTSSMWYVLVYADDDETLVYSANWLSLKDAVFDYNHYS